MPPRQNPHSYTLRAYAPQDFETLYQIDQACFRPGIGYSRRALRGFVYRSGAVCLVAESSDGIAGFILAEHDGPSAHLITIDVCERDRRQGVGTLLMRTLEDKLARRGVRQVRLETATDNQAAIAFYQKYGYRTLGILKRYYLGRIDAYDMRKTLACS